MNIKERIKNIDRLAYYSKANLHAHSSYSDGEMPFDKLIEQAKELGLEHFSITDHNTLKGYYSSIYLNEPFLIPGVEFDCFTFPTIVHIIGYGVDINNEELKALCCDNQSTLHRILHARSSKRVIDTIHKAGGIAVFAHPCCCWVPSLDRLVKKLKNMGLDGIEVYYPYNRFRGIVKFHSRKCVEKLANKYDLIITGGTDEHGSLL